MTNLLFSFQGRINRAKFWLVHLGIFVIEAIVLSLMGGTAAIMSGDYELVIVVFGGASGVVWTIVGVLAWAISDDILIAQLHADFGGNVRQVLQAAYREGAAAGQQRQFRQ